MRRWDGIHIEFAEYASSPQPSLVANKASVPDWCPMRYVETISGGSEMEISEYVSYDGLELAKLVRDGDGSDAWSQQWSKRQGVVELFPCLSSPNRTCTSQRIRLSIQERPIAMATS